jgi:hypothetical protein
MVYRFLIRLQTFDPVCERRLFQLRGPHTLRKTVSTFNLKTLFLHKGRLFSTSSCVVVTMCDLCVDVSMFRCMLVASRRACVRLASFCKRLFFHTFIQRPTRFWITSAPDLEVYGVSGCEPLVSKRSSVPRKIVPTSWSTHM